MFTDAINLVDVANNFAGEKGKRKQLFGKFQRKKVTFLTKATQTGVSIYVSVYFEGGGGGL